MCSLLCRAFSKIHKDENDCWIYLGAKDRGGYAKIQEHKRKNSKASRCIYEIINGVKLGRFDFVCHKCDIPSCINPDHFFIGSPQENVDDCKQKNRLKIMKGEKNGNAILTWEIVDEIRKLRQEGWLYTHLGKKFMTEQSNIYRICKNKTWVRF